MTPKELLDEELSRVKLNIMLEKNTAFISSVIASLVCVIDPIFPESRQPVKTAATNGKYIAFDPDFFNALTLEAKMGLMVHEVMHVVLRHCDQMGIHRFGTRDPKLLNIAMDYVINLMVVQMKFTLPEGGWYDTRFTDMATEEVYAILESENKTQPKEELMDVIVPGGTNATDEEIKEATSKITDIIARAVVTADMQGQSDSVPGAVRIYLKNLYDPSLPWNTVLSRWFTSRVRSGYNYSKPNRRYMHVCPNIIIPKRESKGLAHAAFVMDVSGSVGDKEIEHFVSDGINVVTNVPVQKLTLVQFDEEITNVTVVKSKRDILNTKFIGRGGTVIRPVIEWANEHKPDVVVIFTDGDFDPCHIKPLVPIIYVIHNDPTFTTTYGEVIHYKLKL